MPLPDVHTRRDPVTVLWIVLLGLVSATTGHLLLVALQRHVLGIFSWNWWEPGSMMLALGGYSVVFLIILAVVLPVHLMVPRIATPRRLAGLIAGIAAFGALLVIPRISPWACMVLATGIGIRVGSLPLTPRRPRQLAWFVGVASGVAGLLIGGQFQLDAWRERQFLDRLPPVTGPSPNVLLLILDTVRARSLGMYGFPEGTTPRLDAWAATGVVFEQAYATAPWTLPSHASIFTGRYASQLSADWASPLDSTDRVLAEWFRDQGYATGGFTANLLATGYRSGLSRGFGRYRGTRRTLREFALNSTFAQSEVVHQMLRSVRQGEGRRALLRPLLRFDWRRRATYNIHDRKDASQVLAELQEWQETLGSRPWFAFVNLFDAHHPYESPAQFRTSMGGGATALDAYHGAIRYLDDRISTLLDTMAADGTLANTIVVITSDHGELFGEHGLRGHGNALYRPLLHVPLLLLAPGRVPEGHRVPELVSLRDLARTIQELAGGREDSDPFPGERLVPLLAGEPARPSPIIGEVSGGINDNPRNPTSRGAMIAAVDDSIHVIRDGADSLVAYRFLTDPDEEEDVAREVAGRAYAAERLRAAMRRAGVSFPR